jgi:hypothetical protein
MKKNILLFIAVLVFLTMNTLFSNVVSEREYPIGEPGLKLTYNPVNQNLPESVVQKIELTVGIVEEINGIPYQWIQLKAEKVNKEKFSVWMLTSKYPSEIVKTAQEDIARYILSSSNSIPLEFNNQSNSDVVLPNTGAWKFLLPRTESSKSPIKSRAKSVKLLGHKYLLKTQNKSDIVNLPVEIKVVSLTPDLLIGVPHNSKVKDETRRYDQSDYEYVPLTKENYSEMIENGINVFVAKGEQLKWIETENVYYWGVGGADVSYPECLYTSNYVGPTIFFDEPMVGTRDYVIRPKLKEDPSFRKTITPQKVLEEFKKVYHKKKYEEGPTRLLESLDAREDVSIGDMDFLQQNVYSWETMPSSALYQLLEGDKSTPYAMVFEPPGRYGAKRILPELNMSFDCQIPVSDPKNMIGIVKSFLRGAARSTDKSWGISIYGAVMRSEAFWYMTHAYDQGATLFFYWDNYQLAAVPYNEYLALSKNLREHAKNFPNRNLEKLKHAAEIAILIPPGYNLGHVKMGLGNFSGLDELHMERVNSKGVKYRDVMSNFYIEVERCIRLGVEYDSYWNLQGLELNEYREIVVIREDGKIEVTKNGTTKILNYARKPERPEGILPQLKVEIETSSTNAPSAITARATVIDGSAPIYYTQGAGKDGIYRNTYVLWELYGPEKEDYTNLWWERWDVSVTEDDNSATAEIKFNIKKPGNYRLKVSTSDLAGRSRVVWKSISINN